jgi:hypothetical protein
MIRPRIVWRRQNDQSSHQNGGIRLSRLYEIPLWRIIILAIIAALLLTGISMKVYPKRADLDNNPNNRINSHRID